jgi:serine/threonine-protein kinase
VTVGDETISMFSDANRDPLIGSMVDDYEVKDRVGAGAMGIVYRGVHRVIGKAVAIKVLKLDYADDPEMVNRLIGEARTVNAIRHPGIVDIFGSGTLKTGQPYIVMDLLEGEPLDVFIKNNAPLKLKFVWPILDDILGALGAAHQVGVIHRDLKPGNVFRESHPEARSRIKVIDFGLARTADRAGGSIRPTNPGTLLGTPAFMAPEQVVGVKVTPATDLYAVGGIAYQLLTGHLPHEAPSAIEVLSAKMASDPLPPRHWLPTLDEEIDQWVMALLDRDPDNRPHSAEDARRALRRIGEGRTSSNGPGAAKPKVTGKTPPPKPRGWSDAKTLLVDGAEAVAPVLTAQDTTDRADSPFAATQQTPMVRGHHAPMPRFGPTPLPQSAPVVAAPAQAVPEAGRTVPMPAVSESKIAAAIQKAPKTFKSSPSGLSPRKPTKSIVPLVVIVVVLLAMATVGVVALCKSP